MKEPSGKGGTLAGIKAYVRAIRRSPGTALAPTLLPSMVKLILDDALPYGWAAAIKLIGFSLASALAAYVVARAISGDLERPGGKPGYRAISLAALAAAHALACLAYFAALKLVSAEIAVFQLALQTLLAFATALCAYHIDDERPLRFFGKALASFLRYAIFLLVALPLSAFIAIALVTVLAAALSQLTSGEPTIAAIAFLAPALATLAAPLAYSREVARRVSA